MTATIGVETIDIPTGEEKIAGAMIDEMIDDAMTAGEETMIDAIQIVAMTADATTATATASANPARTKNPLHQLLHRLEKP